MKSIGGWVAVLFALLLSACNQDAGNSFIGTWTKVSGQGSGLVIERNGSNFIVNFQNSSFGKVAGYMKGDLLHVDLPMTSADLTIDKKTGHLIVPGEELVRVGN